MALLGWFTLVVAFVLVLLPPRWDPAIRLKEWNERDDDLTLL